MNRLSSLPVANLDHEQRQLFEMVTGGKRSVGRSLQDFLDVDGSMRGPFNALLYHPRSGGVIQRLGEILRFEGSLTDVQREVAILTVGRHWQAQYEWWAHAKIAANVGVPRDVIHAIKEQVPLPSNKADINGIYEFVRELTEARKVSQRCFDAVHALLGDSGVVELVILVGYYGIISAILNTFQVPLPEGATPPF